MNTLNTASSSQGPLNATLEPDALGSPVAPDRADSLSAEPTRRSLTCNVGRTEQKFRLVAGTGLLAAAGLAPLSRGWRLGLATLGIAELITGSLRYCPVSQALGINTCRDGER